ncbi:MAG: hypothetical protein ACLROW_03720 [Roseburia faecis]
MSVFLLILKIIGIVLLVILGLIVVIALLALFCPFVYRVKGSYHEKICNCISGSGGLAVCWGSVQIPRKRDSTRMCGFLISKGTASAERKRRFRGF